MQVLINDAHKRELTRQVDAVNLLAQAAVSRRLINGDFKHDARTHTFGMCRRRRCIQLGVFSTFSECKRSVEHILNYISTCMCIDFSVAAVALIYDATNR